MRALRVGAWAALVAAIGVAGCTDNGSRGIVGPNSSVVPEFSSVVAVPASGTDNVLSARIAVSIVGADSLRVSYVDASGVAGTTPYSLPVAPVDSILVLGLEPSTDYTAHVEAVADGITTQSVSVPFHTAALPATVASFSMRQISGTAPHYASTGLSSNGGYYAVVFDSLGRVAWYRDLSVYALPVSNVVQQPNGNFTAFLGMTSGWTPVDGFYVEMSPGGDIVHTYRAPAGSYMDDHELQLTGSGASKRAHFFTYTVRTTDLSAYGGSSTAHVAGHQLVRTDTTGATEFLWDAWNNISISEKIGELEGAGLDGNDFDHANALSIDPSGNYLASFRDLNQVMSIDASTGAVLWRLGGVRSDFTFVNDPRGGFSKQHYARMLPNGNVLLYDNGNDGATQESRAAEYQLDLVAKTATLVWEYRHSPAIFTSVVGNANRMANGHTWIAFAFAGRVVDASASGETLWEAAVTIGGVDTSVYRVIPITSLYGYFPP